MIRYLDQQEKGRARALWQEAFKEDSEGFLDYYFKWKTVDNRVLVKEDETGRILSMAHLNPYRVMVRGQARELDYIVGVATAEDSRHQGHMRDILGKILGDMHLAGMPFCYLMPASEAIYLPFDFRFVFDQPLWQMREGLPQGVRREEIHLGTGSRPGGSSSSDRAPGELASWINRWLEARFEVYALRDGNYMDRLEAELHSENGRLYGWYDGRGELKALQAFWGVEKREQRFLYSMEAEWVEPAGEAPADTELGEAQRPAIMARITNAPRMLELVCLNEEAPCDELEVLIKIRDQLIPGNSGLWRWKLDRTRARLTPEPAGRLGEPLFSSEVLDIDVASLASWLFGYREVESFGGENEVSPPWWCRFIRPLGPVFLDEIV